MPEAGPPVMAKILLSVRRHWAAWGIGGLGVLTVLGALIMYGWQFSGPLPRSPNDGGLFGDYLGGAAGTVVALLALALIALAVTVAIQAGTLKTTKQEHKDTREVLRSQTKVLTQQNFESTFFQLLQRFSELVSEMSYRSISGRAALGALYYDLQGRFNAAAGAGDNPVARVEHAYQLFYKQAQHLLGHYFRTLYHVFKFIDTSSVLTDDEKVNYANIAAAQLSTYELLLLFYNGTLGEGKEGFKPFIEKYGLLKHAPRALMLAANHKNDWMFYAPTAFLSYDERKLHQPSTPITSVAQSRQRERSRADLPRYPSLVK